MRGDGRRRLGGNCWRAARSGRRRPLTAVRLSGRNARLVLPGCPAFLQFGDLGELGERLRRRVRQTEQDGLDTGKTEIAGLDRLSGATQTAMKSKNDVFALRAIGRAEYPPQSLWRSNLAASSSRRVGADAR